jgi:hypothetical protein
VAALMRRGHCGARGREVVMLDAAEESGSCMFTGQLAYDTVVRTGRVAEGYVGIGLC